MGNKDCSLRVQMQPNAFRCKCQFFILLLWFWAVGITSVHARFRFWLLAVRFGDCFLYPRCERVPVARLPCLASGVMAGGQLRVSTKPHVPRPGLGLSQGLGLPSRMDESTRDGRAFWSHRPPTKKNACKVTGRGQCRQSQGTSAPPLKPSLRTSCQRRSPPCRFEATTEWRRRWSWSKNSEICSFWYRTRRSLQSSLAEEPRELSLFQCHVSSDSLPVARLGRFGRTFPFFTVPFRRPT